TREDNTFETAPPYFSREPFSREPILKIEYDVQINNQGLSYLSRNQVMEIQSVIDCLLKQKTL
ncbi:hypothetical protein, partial [Butyricimonas virosa]|uniref:hypothetical protein n=1 Tax=Butyricimonas virosa TaxID=544645 RepID=UPI00241EE698